MATDPILALRPVDGSSSAIAVSIANARSMLLEAETAVANAKQERDGGLLDAAPAALAASERKLKAAQDAAMETRERVEAVLRQLEARLVAAKRAETLAEVETARVAAEDAGRALAAWWLDSKAQLASILQEGVTLDTAEGQALRHHARILPAAQASYPDATFAKAVPTSAAAIWWQDLVRDMTEPKPPKFIPLPPDSAEVERDELRRQRDVEREKNGETGGVLYGGYAYVAGARGA